MSKYPVLSTVAGLARILGWLGLALVILLLVLILSGAGNADGSRVVLIALDIALVIPSILLIMFGESIQVLIDIEFNTRRTAFHVDPAPKETAPVVAEARHLEM